jgi:hypothetical protein
MPGNASNEQLLHRNAGPMTLVWMVKFMFAVWFVRYLIDPFQSLADLPVGYSAPVGILKFVSTSIYAALHSKLGLVLIKVGILASCVTVWIPRYRLRAAVFGCVLLLLANTISRGFGHVNHAEIAPWLVTVILTVFMSRLATDQIECPDNNPNESASFGMVLATLVFAVTYSFVGAARLVNGGIEFLGGDSIANSMVRMSHHDWLIEFNLADWMLATPMFILMLKLGTAAVTIFELAAPLCLISCRFRLAFLLFMPAFHLGAIMVFKIDFIENVLTMILFVNLTA